MFKQKADFLFDIYSTIKYFFGNKKKKTFRVSEEDGKNMLSFLEVA